jgi:hypothetical protein
MAWAARRCLACLARRQRAMEELDDLAVHHLVHRIAIEAFRVLRGLPGHEFQYPWETRDEREMPGPFDENVFRRRRQRLREALGVIPHEVRSSRSAPYTRTGTATCASASSVKGAVFGAMSTMARTRGSRTSGTSPTFRAASRVAAPP